MKILNEKQQQQQQQQPLNFWRKAKQTTTLGIFQFYFTAVRDGRLSRIVLFFAISFRFAILTIHNMNGTIAL